MKKWTDVILDALDTVQKDTGPGDIFAKLFDALEEKREPIASERVDSTIIHRQLLYACEGRIQKENS